MPLLASASGRREFIRQTSSLDRFGVIALVLEPADLGGNCSLSWEVTEETIPVMLLDAVLRAIDHVLGEDSFAGDYLSDCRIRVVDGAYNHVDSSINCYVMASLIAMREALRDAGLYAWRVRVALTPSATAAAPSGVPSTPTRFKETMIDIALVTHGTRSVELHTTCSAKGVYVRQSGPPGRCGVISLILEPVASDYAACTLSWEVTQAQIPVRFLDAVISGIKHVMAEEAFDGDYLSGCRIRVVDGAYNETDSKVTCYQIATVMAMRNALRSIGLYPPAPGA